jgi:hypothetical protein
MSARASEMATDVVVGSAVILVPGRRRRLAPSRSRRSASRSTTSAHQPSPDHRPDRITGSTPRPSPRGFSASAPTLDTKSTAARARGWRPRRGDGGQRFVDQSPGSCRSPGRTHRARASLRSARPVSSSGCTPYRLRQRQRQFRLRRRVDRGERARGAGLGICSRVQTGRVHSPRAGRLSILHSSDVQRL